MQLITVCKMNAFLKILFIGFTCKIGYILSLINGASVRPYVSLYLLLFVTH